MLTRNDIKVLKEIFATKKDLEKFSTKDDLNNFALKEDLITFKDEILHEIQGMRQELIIIIGYKDQIEDHEVRLEKLEKNLPVS